MNKDSKKKDNIHKNHRARMHEKFDKTGFAGWSKYEILEYMLYNVYNQRDTNPIAHGLLDYSKSSFVRLLRSSEDFRMAEYVKDVGEKTVRFLRSIKEFMDIYQTELIKEKPIKVDRSNVKDVLRSIEFSGEHEEIVMFCLDRFMRLKSIVRLTQDSGSGYASTSIDNLVKAATLNGAASVILVHNHPSGFEDISPEDIHMTSQAEKILRTFDIFLVDHYILCEDKIVSIKMTLGKRAEQK